MHICIYIYIFAPLFIPTFMGTLFTLEGNNKPLEAAQAVRGENNEPTFSIYVYIHFTYIVAPFFILTFMGSSR